MNVINKTIDEECSNKYEIKTNVRTMNQRIIPENNQNEDCNNKQTRNYVIDNCFKFPHIKINYYDSMLQWSV